MTRTSLEWARDIARAYREALHSTDPKRCAELDTKAVELGQGWIAPTTLPEWASDPAVLDAELSAVDIEHYWRIPASTVRTWAQRGLLEKRCAPDGSVVYRFGDVLDCQARRHGKAAGN